MTNFPVYKDKGIEKHKIASYQMDLKGQATLPVICNYFQEIAGNHAEANGFGYPQMLKSGQMWVLTRMKTEIDKYPKWNDEIFIETWVRNRANFFSERAFLLLDKNKEKLGGALSGWMLLDLKSRRPKKVDNLEFSLQMFPDEMGVSNELKKISLTEKSDQKFIKQVVFDDIDVNQHVNNVKYIEWILGTFPYNLRKTHNIRSFEINYSAETIFGDTAIINTEKLGELNYRCSVIKEENGKEVCRAEINWVKV